MINSLTNRMINYFSGDSKRIQHFIKVSAFAKLIGEMENVDEETLEILEIIGIIHDIGIIKAEETLGYSNGKLQEELGPDVAREILNELAFEDNIIERVCFLIANHHTYNNINGIDYQILVEADFLVNLHEGSSDKKEIQSVIEKIFKTKSGILLCKTMFNV